MSHPVSSFQILTPHPEEHARFYAELFGWSVNADNPMGYRQFDTGSARGIQGGVWPAPPQATAFVQLYIEVESAEAIIERTQSLGGQTLIPLQALPGGDQMAVLRDPLGLTFGIVQPRRTP